MCLMCTMTWGLQGIGRSNNTGSMRESQLVFQMMILKLLVGVKAVGP